MAKPWLDDQLWNVIAPLLPPPKPRRLRYPGRKPLVPRQVLTGILFVLKSGIPWNMLPQELGSRVLPLQTRLADYIAETFADQKDLCVHWRCVADGTR
jgi:transposase